MTRLWSDGWKDQVFSEILLERIQLDDLEKVLHTRRRPWQSYCGLADENPEAHYLSRLWPWSTENNLFKSDLFTLSDARPETHPSDRKVPGGKLGGDPWLGPPINQVLNNSISSPRSNLHTSFPFGSYLYTSRIDY